MTHKSSQLDVTSLCKKKDWHTDTLHFLCTCEIYAVLETQNYFKWYKVKNAILWLQNDVKYKEYGKESHIGNEICVWRKICFPKDISRYASARCHIDFWPMN